MKVKNIFIFIIIILIPAMINSCNNQSSRDSFKEFPSSYSLNAQLIELSETYIHGSFLICDSVIFITNTPDNTHQIHIYNDEFEYLGSGGLKGKGPGEIINPFMARIDYEKDILWFADMGRQELIKFPVDSLVSNPGFNPSQSIPIPKDLWIISLFGSYTDNLFHFADFQSPTNLVSFFNQQGQRIDSLTIYKENLPSGLINSNKQAFMPTYIYQFHPDYQRLVVAWVYSDKFAILKGDGEIIKILKGPDDIDQIPDITNENQIRSYAQIQVDEKYIYMLYRGSSTFDADKNLNLPNRIFVFDWDGQPIASLYIDHPIPQFTLDKTNNRFLSMSMNTGDIIIYDIPDKLLMNE